MSGTENEQLSKQMWLVMNLKVHFKMISYCQSCLISFAFKNKLLFHYGEKQIRNTAHNYLIT